MTSRRERIAIRRGREYRRRYPTAHWKPGGFSPLPDGLLGRDFQINLVLPDSATFDNRTIRWRNTLGESEATSAN
jgi:hypothetical protein